jgi:hypothetical protein
MSDTTATNLFIVSSTPRFYQRLLSGVASHSALGNRILREVKAAHAVRQVDTVRELASILINNPIREFQLIAEYYLVWCDCRQGNYQVETLERIIDQTKTHKAHALITRAAFEGYKGNLESEAYFYLEALRAKPTISQYVDIMKSLAVVKAKEGSHKQSVRGFEKILPILKYAEPIVYFDCLNSLAVELSEAERKDEARYITRHVLASPYALAYPEWQQTAGDLRPATRPFIIPNPSPARIGKLLSMPKLERTEPVKQDRPARVISLLQWKMNMAKKEENDKLAKDRPQTLSERVMYIMNHITAELTDEELDRVINLLDEIHSKKDKK